MKSHLFRLQLLVVRRGALLCLVTAVFLLSAACGAAREDEASAAPLATAEEGERAAADAEASLPLPPVAFEEVEKTEEAEEAEAAAAEPATGAGVPAEAPPTPPSFAPAPLTDIGKVPFEEARANGMRHLQAQEFREAILWLSSAADLRPDDAPTLRALGNAYARAQELPLALQVLEESTRLAPDVAGTWFELTMVAVNVNDLERAEAAARRAVDLDESNPRAVELLATVLHRKRDFSGMVEVLEPAVRRNPDRFESRYFLGLAYFGMHRLEDARDALNEVIRVNPTFAPAYGNLAGVLQRLGDVAGATEARRRAVELSGGGDRP